MKTALTHIWKHLASHGGLLVILGVMVLLRLPNFLEPYWYGDEAIYLTLGNAMNQGSRLYTDIVGHKTPLIYYLARVPDQFSFRLLLVSWMVVTVALYYCFSRKLLGKTSLALLATSLLMVFTTIPLFEGNIPNGELFVMGFVLMGAFLLKHTKAFTFATSAFPQSRPSGHSVSQVHTAAPPALHTWQLSEILLLLSSGIFFGLAILTKVPALLDLAAFMSLFWFAITNSLLRANFTLTTTRFLFKKVWVPLLFRLGILLVGVVTPILISILYFQAVGSGKDYLEYGLLYNFHYTGTWQLHFAQPLLTWAFTFGGKTILLALGMILLTLLGKKITFRLQFAMGWLLLALFATLLSNRPYPHYFIQLFPALGLLIALMGEAVLSFTQRIINSRARSQPFTWKIVSQLVFPLTALSISVGVMVLLHVGLYPVTTYYRKAWLYTTHQMSQETYFSSFDSLVNENYQISEVITQMRLHELFIWGTDPMIYAQTKTVPTSRFTVAFHIKDVNDFQPTFQKIKSAKPKMIIVMRGEEQTFPELSQYLSQNYLVNYQYQHMLIYMRRPELSSRPTFASP